MVEDETARSTVAAEPDPGYAETLVPTWGASATVALPDPGYQLGELIGRGGMGEVAVAHDQRIGREVAVKRIRSKSPTHDAITRFLREARIQARLDHPAIVPVYELGTEADGRPYFTMKRLAGTTLARRLQDNLRAQPLLRAFVDVCLAVEFAHARGIVHRDLKPSNIMLGDYGEVYVLDWGVARVVTDPKRTTAPQMAVDLDEDTTAGAVLGTPGYMAPEQLKSSDVGPAADVYALGAILFEILAGEPLHPRGDAALATTLTRPQETPAKRAADRQIAPELDGACFDSLAADPAARPTARQLAERVQAYLDGDRDEVRRRAIAAEQLASAREALARADVDDDARAAAMRRAGRALALDPVSPEAAELVTSLMLEPPTRVPPELVASLDEEDRKFNVQRSRATTLTLLSLFAFWLVIPLLEVKSWPNLLAFYGLIAVMALNAYGVTRTGRTHRYTLCVLIALLLVAFTRIAGPFVLTPIVGCAALIVLTSVPELRGRLGLVVATVIAGLSLPLLLEGTGVIHRTFEFTGSAFVTISDMFEMTGTRLENVLLIGTNLLFIVITGIVAYTINARHQRAQRQLHIQAWHLRQLLPSRRWQTQPRGTPIPK